MLILQKIYLLSFFQSFNYFSIQVCPFSTLREMTLSYASSWESILRKNYSLFLPNKIIFSKCGIKKWELEDEEANSFRISITCSWIISSRSKSSIRISITQELKSTNSFLNKRFINWIPHWTRISLPYLKQVRKKFLGA